MTDLVLLSLEAWDAVWRRNQYLVAEMLRADPDLRVLFVEPAADPLFQASRRRAPRPGRGLRRGPALDGVGADRLWLFEPTKGLPRRLDPRVDERLARATRAAARRLRMTDPVLWVNDPAGARMLPATGWPALYDVTDDWLAAERTPDEHARLVADEGLLLDRCAEVVVCSPGLVTTKGAVRDVVLVTNGVDVERYRTPLPRPADLPAGRTAVYVGTVHPDRFDLPLLDRTAREADGAGSVVLVGPVVDVDRTVLAGFADAGVTVLGSRPRDVVPAYLQHADVLLVPHVRTPFTESLDPIKAYEYLAVGRPVVSTPVAGFRDLGLSHVHVAAPDDFPAAVRALLRAPGATADAGDVPTWRGQAALMADVVARVARHGATPR
ncbi:glycosyltransferase [Cellulosimicrobium marinum]|uniref:glycosyltransferase n=1 Tax=Cellulosimicrobium marinum TaxID=1638992 RepID=UPI001E401B37|nr:glycosyltransferase [Cellulosimicrobium marinum]MCB7137026.1 glycosyltransferase [Cellulosimicrobium marinum]